MSAGSRGPLSLLIARERDANGVNGDVNATAGRLRDRYDGKGASASERRQDATSLTNEYYDIVTDFYEYGWGQNFHFAPRYMNETFYESLARYEYFLAYHAQFKPTDTVLDVGCGIGGPARNMVRFTSCNVMGVNNNEYQINRARQHDSRYGMSGKINYTKTDFCNMCFGDNEFDGAYAIEATCHSESKVKCYSEVFRAIKPGAYFMLYEWCLTDLYDPANEEHQRVRHGIELGDGLPELDTMRQVVAAVKAAGFVVEESFDMAERFESGEPKSVPWYEPLQGSYTSLSGLRATPAGRWLTSVTCRLLEAVRLAPAGTCKATEILEEGAVNLVKGGELGIFTPSFFVKARKPRLGEELSC
ncbi:Sterol methyltransferase, putative [Trypanosoma equiperdum]|uniref:Methyltransferase n=5 Tax=Trypanozoon TaxID=39700 RepID=Q4FKJ2_TRYB2|nr:sterol 24-c-methyltransferase, putative [Trypanosoma brucei gambiense DAL972]XP_822930.1 sterol 24-c-methyltransferase, putative [Trypanosoma brucei brucei TREU927]AAZ40214.1 sterol methyltransferase [Trypanosoma brucei brucei]RHW69120.1 s-adenosyl-L-methionine-c-24-delta-sterol-methyl transferase a [Trypanosoma brucei equiperdum]SCU65145.1 Sterol methyltransferase, putative [Trypanosoma equiperdum]EAN78102.1 sterol 24-c-methyltransferase, putative [Trypanosoma brucei brucei TREU927]RHW697|eukprot:XP_011778020.1 sterol 24-c-methyltransferase, putative [Trypanosoma brucei gambiense DAL972]